MLSYNICLQTTTRIHVSTAAVSYYLPISCSSSGSRGSPPETGRTSRLAHARIWRHFIFDLLCSTL